jgi:carbonic anhydrase/acetyltransferase-like protein (isoleucine patch superfamily)
MNGKMRLKRRLLRFRCLVERLDDRALLSSTAMISPLLVNPIGYQAVRPNTPVMPFATPSKKASYIDPTVSIKSGSSIVVGYQNFIGPYATLDGRGGAIKIGNGSNVLDNASIVAASSRSVKAPVVRLGNAVVIGFGARIVGPSTIGSYKAPSAPVSIGANALIDQATIEPGAIVSARARVGPGVTVPSGFEVLPGANVTTDAQASNPALGMVVKVTSANIATVQKTLSENSALAAGYAILYQGNGATGANPAATPNLSGINNGNLSVILGSGLDPGPATSSLTAFEPTRSAPAFVSPHRGLLNAMLSTFPARVTGNVQIGMRAWQAALHLGRANAIRADQGQPIVIGSIARTGRHVTINSPLGGSLGIGHAFRAGTGAVILGGPNVKATLGNNVAIGPGAVVDRTSVGSNSSVGAGAYLLESVFPANSVIPPKAIYINNKFKGYVAW